MSSIKHRKSNATTPQNSSDDNSDRIPPNSNNGNRTTPKYRDPLNVSKGSFAIFILIFMATICVAINAFLKRATLTSTKTLEQDNASGLRSTSNLKNKISSAGNSVPLLPFSKFQANFVEPLTGAYTLGETYRLQNDAGYVGGDNNIYGIVHYPTVELASILDEEAIDIKLHNELIMQQLSFTKKIIFSQQQPMQQQEDDDELFFGDKFQSALGSIISDSESSDDEYQNDQALLTRCGYKDLGSGRMPNQDRSVIVHYYLRDDVADNANATTATSKKVYTHRALLMGIFDGHGGSGHNVAHHVALELPRVFATKMQQGNFLTIDAQFDDKIAQVLKQTFLVVDGNEPVKGEGGCTASTAFYPGFGTKVYLANVGDSTTLIVRYNKSTGKSTIVHQNRKDKPHLDDERQRIEKAGGQVYIPTSLLISDESKETSRVYIPSANGMQLALAMSRSIGDFDGKVVGLISEPIVSIWDVQQYQREHQFSQGLSQDSEWFVVIASDGIYDVIPEEEVVDRLGKSLYHFTMEGGVTKTTNPLVTCEQLIRKASRAWLKQTPGMKYRDDITLGVSKLNFVTR
mmetsp:Transcript_31095/g.62040  ORF Transcript_31095/g.62040 Transcript_31095/m.62040 type:complete len:574 (+) Transcript_31095:78-1799(+)